MLTPHEELILKQIAAREPLPRQKAPVKYGPVTLPNLRAWFDEQCAKLKKMEIVNINEDHATENRVKHTMKKDEKLSEWFSRTQIGRAQALSMSKEQITRAVALAEERNREDGFAVQTIRKAEAKQSLIPIHKFLITP